MAEHLTRRRHTRGASLASLSLRNKLLLFAASLVLVPGILLVLIAERSGRESLQRIIGRQLAREAEHTADRLSAGLRTEREMLANFARQDLMREIRVGDIDKRVSLALKTLRDGSPTRLDYVVVEAGGGVVASSDPRLIGPLPAWGDAAWKSPGADELLGPRDTPLRDAPGIVMTTAIHDPDDRRRFLGTLVGFFDWRLLTAVTDGVRRDLASQGIEAEVLVARPDGSVIGGTHSPEREDFGPGVVSAAAASGAARPPPDYTVDEDRGLIVGRASLGSDLPDWRLLVVEPRSHALAPARRLSRHLLLTMGLALIAALGLATLAARRVVEPLSELTRAIRGLSRGGAGPVPVRSDDEVGTLGVAFNEMASELDRAQRELVEAEKFAFVGQLAAGVAHEIRTSLGVLGSSAQILERSLPKEGGEEAGELAGMIHDEVARLGGVVNDLLTLDRARPLELEPTRVSKPMRRAADFVGPQAREKGIRLVVHSIPDEPTVSCDPELVYQVTVNLLVNAIQALGPKGSVEARVLRAEDGYGGFEVCDDGPGIPDDLRERIFQPFVTGRDGGVGVGLTFVKRVVHDHRGLVTVASRPGAGTRFRIRLPLAGATPCDGC